MTAGPVVIPHFVITRHFVLCLIAVIIEAFLLIGALAPSFANSRADALQIAAFLFFFASFL